VRVQIGFVARERYPEARCTIKPYLQSITRYAHVITVHRNAAVTPRAVAIFKKMLELRPARKNGRLG
jgi:hypothetical protein